MAKEIIIEIENGGEMFVEMEGYKGKACTDSMNKILCIEDGAEIKKTADYHKRPERENKSKLTV